MPLEERVEFGSAKQMITADEDFTVVRQEDLKKVDIACGQQKQEGYIGIDAFAGEGVDIVHDLSQYPWPFDDASVYEFRCSHYIEHCRDLVRFMEEVWRCLMPNGVIDIIAPYYSSIRAWQDPTHVRAITEVTFLYFCKESTTQAKLDHYTGKCNFSIVSKILHFNIEWESRSREAQEWAMRHYINVVDDIQVILRKEQL